MERRAGIMLTGIEQKASTNERPLDFSGLFDGNKAAISDFGGARSGESIQQPKHSQEG